MHSLNFLNSYWQFFGVNVWMTKCDAVPLTLELTNIGNVTIENCTFGNWAFRHVKHVMIQNSKSSILKHFPTSLNFYNSSGLIENMNITDLNFSTGLIIQNKSYIQILKSYFVNNTVNFGLIKVLNSSILEMSHCTLQNNKAKDNAGTILTDRRIIYLTKSNFNGNEAIWEGGALHANKGYTGYFWICIFATNNSSMFIYDAIFSRNIGTVILLLNDSNLLAVNSSFLNTTTPTIGGAIYSENSTLDISHSFCYHKKTKLGGTFLFKFSTVALNSPTFSNNSNKAVIFFNNTKASIANCTFESNSAPDTAGALIIHLSNATVSHTTFCENSGRFGGAVSAYNHSSLVISNCSFLRNGALGIKQYNTKKGTGTGGAILIKLSVLKLFQSRFYNNLAGTTGGAVFSDESSLLIHDSLFENNFAAISGGGMMIYYHSSLIIKDSPFINISAPDEKLGTGGGLTIMKNSVAMDIKCSSV